MTSPTQKLSHVYCFLDTNLLIEYDTFDQVDWPSVLNAKKVCLVFARVIFRELDVHKVNYKNTRLRDRARMLRPKLKKLVEQGKDLPPNELPQVRRNVTFLALAKEPKIDWDAEGLDPTINDDRLIASILDFRREHPSADIIFMSEDADPQVTALGHDIPVLDPPKNLKRLPDPPTELEIENKKLRQQLQEITDHMPKLKFGFYENGEIVEEIEQPRSEGWLYQPWEERVQWQLDKKQEELKSMLARAGQSVPEWEVEKFKKTYEAYIDEIKPALMLKYIVNNAPQCRLQFALSNVGTSPAHEVAIRLMFPEKSSVIVLDELDDKLEITTEEPDEPSIPQWAQLPMPKLMQGFMPDTVLLQQNLRAFSNFSSLVSRSNYLASVYVPNSHDKTYYSTNFPFGRDTIKRENKKLVHLRTWNVDPMAVYVSTNQKDGFTIAYTLFIEEWSNSQSGELKVRWK